jgi:indolepyruvate ferredoxin oxidoreductase beta subunit
MSQRGGSVVTYVKCGEEVFSPLVEQGEADVILAFEQLEAARWLAYLAPEGRMLVNTQKINPMPVITGAARYPEGILDWLTANVPGARPLDALKLAEESGSPKAVNTVLVGAMVALLDLPRDVFETALEKTVPARFLELNRKAFAAGFAAVRN